MSNPAKEQVFRKLDELKEAVKWDTFNLTREQQSFLENKLSEFKKVLEEAYLVHSGE